MQKDTLVEECGRTVQIYAEMLVVETHTGNEELEQRRRRRVAIYAAMSMSYSGATPHHKNALSRNRRVIQLRERERKQ